MFRTCCHETVRQSVLITLPKLCWWWEEPITTTILLGWSDWEDGMSLGRGTRGKQTILQWSNLVFLQIYSMTVRLSAMFEEHMKTVFSNWKCAQRHSVLKKLCAARRKRKPTSKTYSFRRDAAGSQPGAVPNLAGLYVTVNINCVAISFSWVLTCCEFWGFHSAIMSNSLFLGCPLLSLLIDLKPIKMKATYHIFPSITRMLSIQKHSVNGKTDGVRYAIKIEKIPII
jgi:hypothetical protein